MITIEEKETKQINGDFIRIHNCLSKYFKLEIIHFGEIICGYPMWIGQEMIFSVHDYSKVGMPYTIYLKEKYWNRVDELKSYLDKVSDLDILIKEL